jgi:hypothetical protein
MVPSVAIERSELRLVWPARLFATEAAALVRARAVDEASMGWLLAEAFYDDRGLRLFQEVSRWGYPGNPMPADPWDTSTPPPAAARLAGDLIRDAGQIPAYEPPRYFSARLAPPQPPPKLTLAQVKSTYGREVALLARAGYFEDAFGSSCSDADADPASEGQRRLSSLLGVDLPLWPLERRSEQAESPVPTRVEENWPDELFYDVVEALHDLVARPRRRHWHDYGQEWDFSDYARAPGQAVYRWRVNDLLGHSDVPLRLAEEGSDVGQLVHATGDPREELLQRSLQSAEPLVRDLVEHAVAQFRRRDGRVAAKREAVKTLADVLEHRRRLLKQELYSGDEGALFRIANEFRIRHMNESQKTDYNPAFLDWIFWWYLATIELTDRLLERQGG